MSVADAHLEIDPEHVIEFTLVDAVSAATTSPSSSNPQKVTLTLKNPDADGLPIAFKIKTTQPRRYLVRPNQGMILPGHTEIIQIVLIEKDKLELLRSYQTMGMVALEQGGNKDKFLIQSTTVSMSDATTKYTSYDAITELWSSGGTTKSSSAMANKKLHVRYNVVSSSSTDPAYHNTNTNGTTPTIHNRTILPSTTGSSGSHLPSTSAANAADMTKEQLMVELHNSKRKYDDLVAFSVNLTAERDMLSNTLEVTKRDYKQLQQQRFMNTTTNARGGSGGGSTTSAGSTTSSRFWTFLLWIGMLVFCSVVSFALGIYIEQQPNQLPSVLQPLVQELVQIISSLSSSTTTTATNTILEANTNADEL